MADFQGKKEPIKSKIAEGGLKEINNAGDIYSGMISSENINKAASIFDPDRGNFMTKPAGSQMVEETILDIWAAPDYAKRYPALIKYTSQRIAEIRQRLAAPGQEMFMSKENL